ncbi:hypothetical protein Pcinc_006302 [Petrolisthes cinctipes]|uniref:Uncharacterized protein n=1 Tax=Petrolisthes cinctipes TaxID=88211 RepID=A0AAE1GBV3_PETCI|nr:hypothetical protein Pcinc_006302 [Petrolisthes cinctipes]
MEEGEGQGRGVWKGTTKVCVRQGKGGRRRGWRRFVKLWRIAGDVVDGIEAWSGVLVIRHDVELESGPGGTHGMASGVVELRSLENGPGESHGMVELHSLESGSGATRGLESA